MKKICLYFCSVLCLLFVNFNSIKSQKIIYDINKNSQLLELKEKLNIPDSTFRKLDLWRNDKCGCFNIRLFASNFFYDDLIFLQTDIAQTLSVDDIIILFGYPNKSFMLFNEYYKSDKTRKYMIMLQYNTESFCRDDETFHVQDVAWAEFYFDINTKKFLKFGFNIT